MRLPSRFPCHAPCGPAAAILLILAAATLTGSPQRLEAQTFAEAVEVRVVNVDVHVSDRKGRPVEGLTADDFVLYEDGREVEITYFHAGSARRPAELAPRRRPTGPGASPPPPPERERPPVWAVVYLDNFNLEPAHRGRVLDDLTRFAESRIGEDVRFLVASYDLTLKVHGGFLRDPRRVVAVIDGLGAGSALGAQRVADYRAVLNRIEYVLGRLCDYDPAFVSSANPEGTDALPTTEDPCDCAFQQMVEAWREYGATVETRVAAAAHGLGELISSLGGVEGRKAVFYVSSGMQQRPGIGVLDYIGELCPHMSQNLVQHMYEYDTTPLLEDLSAHANANRVTFYPIDAAGLRREDIAGVESGSALFRPLAGASQTRRANLQAALWVMAEQTGGQVVLNANQPFDDLVRLAADFDSFYSLGYTPARDADGETHDLKVELRQQRRGATLRYRRSFRDKVLDERLGDRLRASLALGIDDNPLAISATTGEPAAAEGRLFAVPVRIRLPADRLVRPGDDAPAVVRVFLAAEDGKGRRTLFKEKRIELAAGGEPPPAVHELVIDMKLRRGPHKIGVGVRDEIGAVVSVLHLAVDVGPTAATESGPTAEAAE